MARFPPDAFRVRRRGERSRVVQAFSELDLANAPQLEELLLTIGTPPVEEIELDLSEVDLVDAYALRCIQRAARRLAERSCRLIIGTVRPQVGEVLHLVSFGSVVPIRQPGLGPAGAG